MNAIASRGTNPACMPEVHGSLAAPGGRDTRRDREADQPGGNQHRRQAGRLPAHPRRGSPGHVGERPRRRSGRSGSQTRRRIGCAARPAGPARSRAARAETRGSAAPPPTPARRRRTTNGPSTGQVAVRYSCSGRSHGMRQWFATYPSACTPEGVANTNGTSASATHRARVRRARRVARPPHRAPARRGPGRSTSSRSPRSAPAESAPTAERGRPASARASASSSTPRPTNVTRWGRSTNRGSAAHAASASAAAAAAGCAPRRSATRNNSVQVASTNAVFKHDGPRDAARPVCQRQDDLEQPRQVHVAEVGVRERQQVRARDRVARQDDLAQTQIEEQVRLIHRDQAAARHEDQQRRQQHGRPHVGTPAHGGLISYTRAAMDA